MVGVQRRLTLLGVIHGNGNYILGTPLVIYLHFFLILGSWGLHARLLNVLSKRHKDLYSNLSPNILQDTDFNGSSERLSSFIWSFKFLRINDLEVSIYCLLLIMTTVGALAVFFIVMLF